MDGERFDDLLRSLGSRPSRRGVIAGLASGLLALLAANQDAKARKKKRKGNNNKKKRRRCTPTCAGKRCGPDGCGGSCGSCNGGTCANGTCVCSGDAVPCRGACVPGCIGEAVINPLTCDCCQTGPPCETGSDCCSGICQPDSGGGQDYCRGRDLGEPCDFDAQCNQTPCPGCLLHVCRDGHCACPDGLQPCAGVCVPPCTGANAQIPGTCTCCRRNGLSCTGVTTCCSECIAGRCVGFSFDHSCEFDEQCASEICILGFCGV